MTETRVHPPVQFGSYLLTALLGHGAVGRVYRACFIGTDDLYAVKALHPDLVNPARAKEALAREAQVAEALRRAKSPHLLLPLRFEAIGAQEALVMPYVDGWTLKSILAWCREHGSALNPTAVLDLMIQLCRGLHVAHELKIGGQAQALVHRDLKPANILVGRDGTVYILDFGIAKFRDRMGEETRVGRMVGTPHYLSPEQARGAFLDRRSDLFALASVLFEAATGRHAFPQPSIEEEPEVALRVRAVMASIAAVDPAGRDGAKVDELNGIIPGAGDVLATCWQRNPNDRFDSAFALNLRLTLLRPGIRDDGWDMKEWILAHKGLLPPQVPDGDFGRFGPPPEVLPDDAGKTSIFLQAIRSSDALAPLSEPQADPIFVSSAPDPDATGTAALPAAPSEARGIPFGRYRLLNKLGVGGYATVYRARTPGGKVIALKVLHRDLTDEPDARHLLEREARLGALLANDPSLHVVQIFPLERIGGHLVLPMSWISGWTLDQMLYMLAGASADSGIVPRFDGGLPLSVVLDIALQVCRGLVHIHRLSVDGRAVMVVHRDLKPGNIMVTREGVVKILDFGVARMDDALHSGPKTRGGITRGTLAYMSPEQARGEVLDPRSDLFSLGSVIYELLLSERAFPQTNPFEAIAAILYANPVEMEDERRRVASVAPDLARIVADCHARNQDERFHRATELIRELEAVARMTGGVEGAVATFVREHDARLPKEVEEGVWGSEGAPTPVLEGDRETNIFHALPEPGSPESLEFKFVAPLEASLDEASRDDEDARPTEIVPSAHGDHRVAIQPIQPPTRVQSGYRPPPSTRFLVESVGEARLRSSLALPLAAVAAGVLLLFVGFALTLCGDGDSGRSVVVESPTPVFRTESEDLPPLAAPSPEAPALEPEPTTPRVLEPATIPEQAPERVLAIPEPTGTFGLDSEPIRETSKLSVNTDIRSAVYLDGIRLGETPMPTHEIPAGEHLLRFECLECSEPVSREYTILAEPNATVRRVVRFAE